MFNKCISQVDFVLQKIGKDLYFLIAMWYPYIDEITASHCNVTDLISVKSRTAFD